MIKDRDAYHDPWCIKCIYYGRSTRSCDYILIENHSRPCPGGAGCTARRTRKDMRAMKNPKWDTELGQLLWLEGKSDGAIADEFGIAISTVTSYRKRHWEKQLIRAQDIPVPETPSAATPPRGARGGNACA